VREVNLSKLIRVGVLGCGRGSYLAGLFAVHDDIAIVAGCDLSDTLRNAFSSRFPHAYTCREYDELLAHEFDVLILASYCMDHGSDAVRALRAGKHVFSEVTAFHTMAEAVALVEAVEETGRLYSLAENYIYFRDVLEMQHIFADGQLGKFAYGQGQYVQDIRRMMARKPDGSIHWRAWLPPFYYGSHALAPVLQITGTRPISVIGQAVGGKMPRCANPIDFATFLVQVQGGGSIEALVSFSASHEPLHAWYSIYGTQGQTEGDRLRVQHLTDLYVYREGDARAEFTERYRSPYRLRLPGAKAGQGEGDHLMVQNFVQALDGKAELDVDIYRACDFTAPGILAYRSSVEGGRLLPVPDLREPSVRDHYRSDHFRCPREEAVRAV
jgi:predicted dehydrogenase